MTTATVRPVDGARARSLLVIDDEPQIRRAVKQALHDLADTVVEAGTGREGMDLAAASPPDLIVLDLGLHDMPGADVCREVHRRDPVGIDRLYRHERFSARQCAYR